MGKGVAVVTGGTAGIGLATAQHLAREGRPVAILARHEGRLEEAQAMLRRSGVPVLGLSVDMAEAEAVDAAANRIERELGPIAAWVNNAMSTVIAPADKISAADYARVTATTYLGQVHGTLAALRHMKPRNRGTIVQVSSILGYRGVPMQAPYCAAKFAVSGFTDSLRAELIADKIAVNLAVVYLPAVNTPQFGWSRNLSGREQVAPEPVFDPRICAEAIAGAIAKPTREVWVGARTLGFSIGQSVAPAIADRVASGFAESQLGKPQQHREGNLYEAAPGPASIDGPWRASVTSSTGKILNSKHQIAVKWGIGTAIGGLAAATALILPKLLRGGRRRW